MRQDSFLWKPDSTLISVTRLLPEYILMEQCCLSSLQDYSYTYLFVKLKSYITIILCFYVFSSNNIVGVFFNEAVLHITFNFPTSSSLFISCFIEKEMNMLLIKV